MNKIKKFTLILILFPLVSCSDFKKGIDAFYAGEYEKAEELLKPFAEDAREKDPVFRIKNRTQDDFEEILARDTKTYFEGWQAYIGSLFGLEKIEEGCENLEIALRPIKVFARTLPNSVMMDPLEGDFWPAEAKTLRSWRWNIPCFYLYDETL